MPIYAYEALDSLGQRIKDKGEFGSVADLYAQLRAKGLTLLDCRRQWLQVADLFPRRVKRTILAEFFRNFALLVRGGVPLKQALEDMCRSSGDAGLKQVLRQILLKLEDGYLLSEAMRDHKKTFSRILIVLASIGEETGNLDRTLEDAAQHLERIEEIISNTKRALIYPIFVAVAMTGALTFWMVYVLPKILELFVTMDIKELPWATRVLMAGVAFFKTWWPAIPAIVLVFVIFYWGAQKNDRLKYFWDIFWSKTPLIGTILKASHLAFFFEYVALLTAAGIHIVRSLEIMEASLGHQVLKAGIHQVRTDVIAGYGLAESFAKIHFFEPLIIRLVSVGEQTGNMPEQLKTLAGYYLDQVNKLVEIMAKTLEPALIVFAGVIFMLIALGLLGPIYDMMSKIQ